MSLPSADKLNVLMDEYNRYYSSLIMAALQSSALQPELVQVEEYLDEFLNVDERDEVLIAHKNFMAAAEKFTRSVGTTEIGGFFESYSHGYESLQHQLRILWHNLILRSHGINPQSGFKTEEIFLFDMERELERRARRGQPFTIVMVRIGSENVADTPLLVKAMQICMRSFDDVYMLKNNDYLVSLKHCDSVGGMAFVERLKYQLTDLEKERQIVFSSCVAEPLPGDDVQQMQRLMCKDLDEQTALGEGNALQYHEMSDLQRFVKDNMKG